ncbi:MAG: hypothetical protein KGL39_58685 [Patescibacteria group bacterium]|nr:hypothetical protein [Patescibacteria group bacterium]
MRDDIETLTDRVGQLCERIFGPCPQKIGESESRPPVAGHLDALNRNLDAAAAALALLSALIESLSEIG